MHEGVRIVCFRSRDDTFLFDLEVETHGQTAWKKEEDVQNEHGELLYKFWERMKGRDRYMEKDPLYHIFKILQYNFTESKYLVHWYDKSDGGAKFTWRIGMQLFHIPIAKPFRKGARTYSYAKVTEKEQEIVRCSDGMIIRWSKPDGGWHLYDNESYVFWDDTKFQDLLRVENPDTSIKKRKRRRKSRKQQAASTAASAIVHDIDNGEPRAKSACLGDLAEKDNFDLARFQSRKLDDEI
ncbi:hypothetical protein PG985_006720 [Apiospora marii]|uniref:Uncharacterized protein n=1 Tax=Apiospora marii TaxID=335849 RepID=A0ABR1S8U7_9PEZI